MAGAIQLDVLVVGDANPDLVLAGDVVPRFGQAEQLLDSADLVLGGSAAIVACGLARLGLRTALAAYVGDDAFGRVVRDALGDRGVDLRWLRVHPEAGTGLSVILAHGDRAILTHPGAIGATGPELLPSPDSLAGTAHVHSASLYLLPGLAPVLPGWLAEVRGRGVTTSVDTNFDPAERWTAARAVIASADVVLPNAAELRGISGTDDLARAGQALAAQGRTIALKNGAEGGTVWAPDGTVVSVPGLSVDVVDTTGAGDSFDAGFISGLVAGEGYEACLRRGVAAGSLSTRAAGGTAAQPDPDELAEALGGLS
jgi:sugar/nucleoside kinase (ribokinase family)